jgi:hypothetical protein
MLLLMATVSLPAHAAPQGIPVSAMGVAHADERAHLDELARHPITQGAPYLLAPAHAQKSKRFDTLQEPGGVVWARQPLGTSNRLDVWWKQDERHVEPELEAPR